MKLTSEDVLRFNESFIVKMKYKKKIENLKRAQAWYDRQSPTYQKECKRPGSVKQRIITGTPK